MSKLVLLKQVIHDRLFRLSGALLFVVCCILAAGQVSGQPAPKLFYTDWTVTPGAIYYLGSGGEQVFLNTPEARLYNMAVGPEGALLGRLR
jgi:hypothetical protein